jgi:molybdenum cofactor guanylyltransferase
VVCTGLYSGSVPDAPGPAALLLTGGASRRMGTDKAMLTAGGSPWGRRTAALLAAVADPVIEVGPGYTGLRHVCEVPAGQGPLAAVAAGWAALGESRAPASVLVLATDLPRLTEGLLHLLASHPDLGCIVPVDTDGRAQPLCARYPARVAARAEGLLGAGKRAVRELLVGADVTWLAPAVWGPEAGRPDALSDVDTPDQLSAILAPAASDECVT